TKQHNNKLCVYKCVVYGSVINAESYTVFREKRKCPVSKLFSNGPPASFIIGNEILTVTFYLPIFIFLFYCLSYFIVAAFFSLFRFMYFVHVGPLFILDNT